MQTRNSATELPQGILDILPIQFLFPLEAANDSTVSNVLALRILEHLGAVVLHCFVSGFASSAFALRKLKTLRAGIAVAAAPAAHAVNCAASSALHGHQQSLQNRICRLI